MTYTINITYMAEASGKPLSAVIFNDIFFDDWISEFIHVSAQNARNIDAIASVSKHRSMNNLMLTSDSDWHQQLNLTIFATLPIAVPTLFWVNLG